MTGHELSVNIEYAFTEAGDDLADRLRAAAAAGFTKVEIFTTAGRDVPALAAAAKDAGVEIYGMVSDPRIGLWDRANHQAFLEHFDALADDANLLGCPNIVVPSGIAVPFLKRPVQLDAVAEAIGRAVEIAQAKDLTILLEAVNTRMDHPGVLFGMTQDSAYVARAVNSPRVRLLYDLYHSIVEGENPADVLPTVADLLGHVQLADAPGRGEPGAAGIDWPAALDLIDSVGYTGVLGIECYPTKETTAAMEFITTLVASRGGDPKEEVA